MEPKLNNLNTKRYLLRLSGRSANHNDYEIDNYNNNGKDNIDINLYDKIYHNNNYYYDNYYYYNYHQNNNDKNNDNYYDSS